MDTYYDVENTNTGGMIVNVTKKKVMILKHLLKNLQDLQKVLIILINHVFMRHLMH